MLLFHVLRFASLSFESVITPVMLPAFEGNYPHSRRTGSSTCCVPEHTPFPCRRLSRPLSTMNVSDSPSVVRLPSLLLHRQTLTGTSIRNPTRPLKFFNVSLRTCDQQDVGNTADTRMVMKAVHVLEPRQPPGISPCRFPPQCFCTADVGFHDVEHVAVCVSLQ